MSTQARTGRVGILGVATASPEHEVSQAQAKAFARSFFVDGEGPGHERQDSPALARALSSFDNAGIATRQIAQPIAWLQARHDFPTKNAAYLEAARELSRRAGAEALRRAGVEPREIGAVVFASSTGIATPSLDARLVQDLDLPRSCARVPLWGLGCAGGGAGVGRAMALARGLGKPVLVVACELCTLTFVHGDRRKANLIAVALFGDGAAATVVAPEPWWTPARGPELLSPYARLLDDTEDVMGWDLEGEGLRVRFSPVIPALTREHAQAMAREAAATAGLAPEDLRHFVVHPGGRKVLEAYRGALTPAAAEPGAEDDPLRHAAAVLRDHGNMSSPTVLFVLERFLDATPASGEAGLLLALGPGFCAEGAVLRW